MNELTELLVEVSLALPEAYESYLDGEGDQRQRLHGLRFDLGVALYQADHDPLGYEDAVVFADLRDRLDAILA